MTIVFRHSELKHTGPQHLMRIFSKKGIISVKKALKSHSKRCFGENPGSTFTSVLVADLKFWRTVSLSSETCLINSDLKNRLNFKQ
jgi:hypothetical protein